MKPFKLIKLADTEWPVPEHWSELSPHMFQGPEGLLKLMTDEGFLIDPARCRAANASRPAEWSLLHTRNGLGIVGRYIERGAHVCTYAVRAGAIPEQQWLLPEVQATYVLPNDSTEILKTLMGEVEIGPLAPVDSGELDRDGHAAMGPVPVHPTWRPQGDWTDQAKLSLVTGGDALLTLIGGGWIDFSDSTQCCGLVLEPLGWRQIFPAKIDGMMASLSKGGAVTSTRQGARVWGYELAKNGMSYECRDHSGRPVAIGAVWADQFTQIWHLRYWLDPQHAAGVEETFIRSRLT